MEFTVNLESNVAVYLQIENQISFGVASGRLKPGERLPSVRDLSDQARINPNTTAKAYRALEVMGMLFTKKGKGVYLRGSIQPACRKRCRKMSAEHLFEAVQEGKCTGMSKSELTAILTTSYNVDTTPYAGTPPHIAAMGIRR